MPKVRATKRNLNVHEDVSLFPSLGRFIEKNRRWLFEVNGAVFDPEDITLRKRILVRVLSRAMKIDKSALESPFFQERIRAFVAATEKGKRISIRVGEKVVRLQRKSKRNGHFKGTFTLDEGELEELRTDGIVRENCLTFHVVTSGDDDRQIEGRAHLLSGEGTSVISDIDDTIKHTDVTCRKEMVANTFFREFRSIDGISSVYQDWAKSGVDFHYVSSSPWQLYKPLCELFDEIELPDGSVHLRDFLLRDQVLKRVMFRRKGKSIAINRILKCFPDRKFVLIGDSREKDPEIYGKASKKFPGQVQAILVREFDDRPMDPERIEKVESYCEKGETTCHVFQSSDELASLGDEILLSPSLV